MKSTDFLNEAITTQSQRAQDHGYDSDEGERSAGHVVRIFNAITGRNLTTREGWIFALALKLARNEAQPGGYDTLVDLVSYASLLAEQDVSDIEAAEVDQDRHENMLRGLDTGDLQRELKRRYPDGLPASVDDGVNIDRLQLSALGSRRLDGALMTMSDGDGWIKHDGGDIPDRARGLTVEVKFKNDMTRIERSAHLQWKWSALNKPDFDIIEYRIVK